jgi:membrane fusion protein, heavy metal efflux system
MVGRLPLAAFAFTLGIAVAGLTPGAPEALRNIIRMAYSPGAALPALKAGAPGKEAGKEEADGEEKPTIVKLTDEQVANGRIEVAAVEEGVLARRVTVPGAIVPDANRIARVSVKLSGTVAELRKNLGDLVKKDEVLGILESREVADAKSEFLAARLTSELQQELFERAKAIFEKRISAEQDFLRSRNLAAQAKMRLNIARQKLFALGLTEPEIFALPDEPEPLLRRQEVRSPIAGQVAERKVDLGTAVGRDNLETELFVVVDLDRVWVEAAVNPSNLPAIKVGQVVSITARDIVERATGKIMFISPLLDKESRSARVVAELSNEDGVWRPGTFVTAAIMTGEEAVAQAVPEGAIQIVNKETVVFVRTPEGFEKRRVTTGRSDNHLVEIVAGLEAGEKIAVTNAFLLKAELLKSSADED